MRGGPTNARIGERLLVAEGTVEDHVKSLMREDRRGHALGSRAACHWHLLAALTRRS